MENLNLKKIRRCLYLLVIFIGLTVQTGFSNDLLTLRDLSPKPAAGIDPVTYSFGCINGQPGDTICVPVTVTNFSNIVIFQYEIIWNSNVLDFIEINNPGSPSINVLADFNLSGPNALKVIPLGFPLNGETLPDGTVLFEICFRIVGTPGSSSCVGISPYFDFESVDNNGVVPSDSVNCCMTVDNAVNLVAYVTSCGPVVAGGNGTIDITAYGGTPQYNITWVETIGGATGGVAPIPVEGGSTVINVPAGNYDVTLTDGMGNIVTYNVDVAPLELSITTHLKDPTCYKFENGTIWIKPVGGAEPFSYIWTSLTDPSLAGSGFIRNAGDSSLVTSLPDGMYSILVKDNNGCEETITVTLNDNPFIITITNQLDATCLGSTDGVIDLSFSGATPLGGNYTVMGNLTGVPFQISTPSVSLGNLKPGMYSIKISDNVSQCDTTYTFTIGYTDTITANLNVINPACPGGNGTLSIRGLTNGVSGPAYTYSIFEHGNLITTAGPVGGFFNYSPLTSGNYVVVVKENTCTSDSIHFTVTDPLPMMVTLVGRRPDNCIPTPTGDAWFHIDNGIGPYTLSAGAGFQDADTLFNMNSGSYILTVTDNATLCTATLPFMIDAGDANEEADITFQINGTPCDGGTVTVLYQGGALPIGAGVLWTPGNLVTPTITITPADSVLSVDLILGSPIFCILTDTVHIPCDKVFALDITVVQPVCGEGAVGGPYTGTVIVDTLNATPPVTWYWSIPDTTTTGIYAGLAPGKYYVTVTDAMDSTAVDSFEIIAPNTLNLMFSNIDSASCPGVCDGGVRIIPANGDPNLDYNLYWDPITPMADTGVFFNITNLCAGLDEFTVSQDGLCFYKDTVEIFEPLPVDISLVQSIDATCFGDSNGLLEVSASGGTPGYTYNWQGGPSTALYNNLQAGTYVVTATDSKNCVQEDSFTVVQPDILLAQIDSSATFNLSCGSSNDGVITLEVSGGNTGGYTYIWNPNVSPTYQAVNLSPGFYAVTVSDSKGCSDTTSYTLTSPPPLVVTWPDVASPNCFGDETIFLIQDVTGGNGNYSFNINGGGLLNIGDPVMLPSGIYVVSVFDDRGCSSDSTYMILEPDPILVSINPPDGVINLGDSLLITGIVNQGTNPIATTLWTSSEPMSCPDCPGTWVFNSLPTIYTWTVTDINGCTGSASATIDVDYNRDVYIPNVFTPNGDGRNDDFRIFTGLGVVSINYMNIYDRWGNLLHSEKDLLPSPVGAGNWDGSSNGQPLNPGVYIYVASITFIDNNTTLVYRGDVTLLK